MGSRALIGLGALAAVVAIVAAIVPPAHPLVGAAAGALIVGLALHGLGRAAGWLAGDDDAPAALAIAWGLALYVALGGALAAIGAFTRPVQIAIAVAGVGLGALWIARRADALAARARGWRPGPATLVTIAAALLVAVHVLGGAGARHGAFADGDGDLLGPLARLAQTGALPDAIGAPRTSGLGGSVIATSLGWVFGDWRASHAVDGGLGLALALALVLGLRGPGPARPYAAVAIAALAIGLPALPPDLAPRWIVIALVIATHASLRRTAPLAAPASLLAAAPASLLATLTAAAVAAITHGGLGLALVVVLAGPRRRRRAALAAAVLAGYVLAAVRARAALAAAPALIAPGLGVRLAIGGGAAAVLWALLSAATRARGERALAILLAAATVAIAAALALSSSLVGGALAALPFVVAALLIVAVIGFDALAAPLSPLAVVAGVTVVLALGGLRFAIGVPPRSWGDREGDVLDAARAHLGRARHRDVAEAEAYHTALAAIPGGARVGLWVDRADLVDYRGHAFVDLRSADAVACRAARRAPARPLQARCRELATLPRHLHLDYLVVAPAARIEPGDPVLVLAGAGRTVVAGELIVVELPP